MRKPGNLPQTQLEYVGLMARLIELAERGRGPNAGLLARLYSLQQTLLRAGIDPDRLFAEQSYPGSGTARVQGEGGPESLSQAGIIQHVVFNRVTEINESGYVGRLETLADGELGSSGLIEKPLILTCSGRRAREEDIAGRCDLCGGWDLEVFSCQVCHASICSRHVCFLASEDGGQIALCPKHFRKALRRMDMWELEDRRK